MKVLEEWWYGNIEPTDGEVPRCKEYKKLVQLVSSNEDKLRQTMTDAQKELLTQYMDSQRELGALMACTLFQNSFRLGARVMLEVMEE